MLYQNQCAITRREILKCLISSSLAILAAEPMATTNAVASLPPENNSNFLPENDYPYFGWNPDPN